MVLNISKISPLFHLLLLLFLSCEFKNKYLSVPDKVNQAPKETKFHLPGTKFYIDKPEDYVYVEKMMRFYKDESTFIQLLDFPNANFNETFEKLDSTFESLNAKMIVNQKIDYGPYKAVMVGGDFEGREQLLLMFGDSRFSVMVGAYFPQNNYSLRKEIAAVLLTVDYDPELEISIEKNYNIDIDSLEFMYSERMALADFYTLDGEKILQGDFKQNFFMVQILPPSDKSAKDYSESLLEKMIKKNEHNFEIIEDKRYWRESNEIVETQLLIKIDGNEFIVYQFVKETERGMIALRGNDISKSKKYIDQYKKIAKSIEILF